MITRIGLAPRRRGLSIETFQSHWLHTHAPIVASLPGIRRYWQNHQLLHNGQPLMPWAGFDACAEMSFDSVAAMTSALADERYQREVRADSEYLVDKSLAAYLVADRIHLGGCIDREHVRLMTFMRLAHGAQGKALHEALQQAPMPADATAHELFLAIEQSTPAAPPNAFEAVEVLWFKTASLALRHLVSDEAYDLRRRTAALVRGVERLVAKVELVVDEKAA